MTTLKYGAKGIPVKTKPATTDRATHTTRPVSQAPQNDFVDIRLAARRRRRKQKQILFLSISLVLVLLTMLALWLSG